jgi:hypothetical protein
MAQNRRTIRVVLFTAEENGIWGGRAYADERFERAALGGKPPAHCNHNPSIQTGAVRSSGSPGLVDLGMSFCKAAVNRRVACGLRLKPHSS